MYADVAFPISSFKIFTYKVPDELKTKISIGCRVKVPFKSKFVNGIIVKIKEESIYKGNLKTITLIDEFSIITKELWDLAIWISNYYHSPIGKVIKAMIPFSLSSHYKPQPSLSVLIENNIHLKEIHNLKLRAPRQYELFNVLNKETRPIQLSKLKQNFPYRLK